MKADNSGAVHLHLQEARSTLIDLKLRNADLNAENKMCRRVNQELRLQAVHLQNAIDSARSERDRLRGEIPSLHKTISELEGLLADEVSMVCDIRGQRDGLAIEVANLKNAWIGVSEAFDWMLNNRTNALRELPALYRRYLENAAKLLGEEGQ